MKNNLKFEVNDPLDFILSLSERVDRIMAIVDQISGDEKIVEIVSGIRDSSGTLRFLDDQSNIDFVLHTSEDPKIGCWLGEHKYQYGSSMCDMNSYPFHHPAWFSLVDFIDLISNAKSKQKAEKTIGKTNLTPSKILTRLNTILHLIETNCVNRPNDYVALADPIKMIELIAVKIKSLTTEASVEIRDNENQIRYNLYLKLIEQLCPSKISHFGDLFDARSYPYGNHWHDMADMIDEIVVANKQNRIERIIGTTEMTPSQIFMRLDELVANKFFV